MDQLYRSVISACRQLLLNYPGAFLARQYLDNRIPSSSQEEFQFGYFPPSDQFDALISILDEDVLIKSKLRRERIATVGIYQKIKVNTFEDHNLILPYRDVYGSVAAIVGRTLLTEDQMQEKQVSKYKNTSFEKKRHLFGLYEGKKEIVKLNCCFVVEGQFDCIAAHAVGIKNVVAVGSSSMTGEQLALIKRYTDNIYLLFDNDEPGSLGADRVVKKYSKSANIVVKKIPSGYKDLDELVKSENNLNYRDLMNL